MAGNRAVDSGAVQPPGESWVTCSGRGTTPILDMEQIQVMVPVPVMDRDLVRVMVSIIPTMEDQEDQVRAGSVGEAARLNRGDQLQAAVERGRLLVCSIK